MSAFEPGDVCSVDRCGRSRLARGLCGGHYWRLRTYGDVLAVTVDRLASIQDRIMSHVTTSDTGCWLWTKSVTSGGYARVKHEGRTHAAHRLLYELTIGSVPADLELDHICRVRRCVNPAHLEPVTPRENTMRAPTAPAAINAAKTRCDHGHPFDAANTQIDSRAMRQCRTCRRASVARYYAKTREAAR